MYGVFPLWLVPVVASSHYGYFILPLWLLFGGAIRLVPLLSSSSYITYKLEHFYYDSFYV